MPSYAITADQSQLLSPSYAAFKGHWDIPLRTIQSTSSLKIEDTSLDNSGSLPWTRLPKGTDLGIGSNEFLINIGILRLFQVFGRFVVASNGLMGGQTRSRISLASEFDPSLQTVPFAT